MTLNTYLNRFRSVKHLNHRVMSWNACNILMALFPVLWVFWRNKHPRWKIPLENPWKYHFWDSKFQNVPRCLGLQELVPLAWVPKPPPKPIKFWKWPPSKIAPPPPTPSQVINNQPLNQSILHDLIVRLSLYSRTSIQATPGLPLRGRGWGFPLAIMNVAPSYIHRKIEEK